MMFFMNMPDSGQACMPATEVYEVCQRATLLMGRCWPSEGNPCVCQMELHLTSTKLAERSSVAHNLTIQTLLSRC